MNIALLTKRPIIKKEKTGSELLWRKENDKHILLARHDMYVLNEFSKEVIDMCNGSNDVKDIVNKVVEKYQIDKAEVTEKVTSFLEFLLDRQLIFWED
jgi:ABC-type polysaccharide/polyol phosphate transport system ATPase subunit